ncbi:Putative nuclease [Frankliniella fusca]|uniref:Nuclease n=1 Tax=Frankliniella fusca TaxID=407009 RepID=A0AAE1HMP4_9NEOP|nr:Putative nuclease [Frankliniella fusca]
MENNRANILAAVALAVHLNEEAEDEIDRAMLAAAQVVVLQLMEDEEPWVDAGKLHNLYRHRALEASWVYVTVNLNEYHTMNDAVFKMHFRMSRRIFELLVQTVGNHLNEKGRMQRHRTDLQDILLMVVWVLATPDSFRSVALRFGRRPTTLWYFYSYVIMALRELAPRFIAWPTEGERRTIKEAFERASGFPGVIGSIDGTHVYISAPVEDAAHFINRHDTYSMNVQAVVDHTLLVRHLHVGEVGSMHDNRVFRRSPLLHDLLKEGNERILNDDEHLLGDGAYPLTNFMMIPFPRDGPLTEAQCRFNRKLSQCRVRVENAFARAKGKWRRLKYLHARNPAIVLDYIVGSFVLHNFTILNGEQLLEEDELARPINNNQVLEDQVFDDEDDLQDLNADQQEDEERLEVASIRGLEKRIMYMENLI